MAIRLDQVLVARGLCDSREKAKRAVMAGQVLVNGQVARKPSDSVCEGDAVELAAVEKFVSRGGHKLEHALEHFELAVNGLTAIDLGASTGGFTDCLLQRGAQRVYAVDVGYGQLDQRLRDDPRVVSMERVNARYLDGLPEPVAGVVIDVSFISLALILPVAAKLLVPGGWCVPLIKPQFEAGRRDVGKGGVVRDPAIRRRVIREVVGYAFANGFGVTGVVASPILGPAGNAEFLACFRLGAESDPEIDRIIDEVSPS